MVANNSGGLEASGVLSFATAAEAWRQLRSAIEGEQAPRQLDLAGIRHSDSAGLSCVLAIVAEAAGDGHRLQVLHMPEGMRALAQVCEIDGLLV
ncbi:MAG: STAS domain-containing protein [Rhodanobacter sp.]|nr:MAG: STAS domain-containing protein [Rhodanobacter sp.]